MTVQNIHYNRLGW